MILILNGLLLSLLNELCIPYRRYSRAHLDYRFDYLTIYKPFQKKYTTNNLAQIWFNKQKTVSKLCKLRGTDVTVANLQQNFTFCAPVGQG
jgi:hypothetical protein